MIHRIKRQLKALAIDISEKFDNFLLALSYRNDFIYEIIEWLEDNCYKQSRWDCCDEDDYGSFWQYDRFSRERIRLDWEPISKYFPTNSRY